VKQTYTDYARRPTSGCIADAGSIPAASTFETPSGSNCPAGFLASRLLFSDPTDLRSTNTSQVTIANSTFRENANSAPQIRAETTIDVSETTFESNKTPIRVTARSIGGIGEGNTFEVNDN